MKGEQTMKHYENLEEAMCRELEMLDKKYGSEQGEMSTQDVEKADVLYHALKSAATYHAMKAAEDGEDDDMEGSGEGRMSRGGRSYARDGRSYRRGRDSMGRYTSRDMGYSGRYDDGYSGHYPEWMPPMYPRY